MRSPLPALMTEDQLSAVKAALTAAAAGNPCGEEQAARYEILLDELLEEWGATSLRQLPASSFRHVLNWCAQRSLPDERGKLERHAQAALDDLKAAAHALHEYREALRGVRAVAGELASLDRELVPTKGQGTGMALGLLRLARGLDQQEGRE